MTINLTVPVYIPPVTSGPNYAAQDDAAANAYTTTQDDDFRTMMFSRLAAEKATDAQKNNNDHENADAGQQPASVNIRLQDAQKKDKVDTKTTQDQAAKTDDESQVATDTTTDTADVASTAAITPDIVESTAHNETLNATITTPAILVKTPPNQNIGTATTATSSSTPGLDSAARQKLMAFLNNLLGGIPAEQKDAATLTPETATSTQVKANNSKSTSATLIATGLTPEKLTQITESLKKKTQTGDDLTAGAVQIQTPPVKRDTLFTPGALSLQAKAAQNNAAKNPVTNPDDASGEIAKTQVNPLTADSTDTPSGATAPAEGFDNILKMFENAKQPTGAAPQLGSTTSPTAASALAANAAKHAAVSASLSTVPNTAGTTADINFAPALSGQIFPDGTDWSTSSAAQTAASGQTPGIALTGPALATSIVLNVVQSSSPHPATQIVASTITKSTADGQSKDITLRLDPPELGKVEVQMRIDKDQTIKAHVVVEKPETYMMLQRDSHVLQRALNDAGLNAGGNSLSFELGQNGTHSNQGQGSNGNGHGNNNSAGSANNDSANVLETKMDWSFNADTGQTHYNILA